MKSAPHSDPRLELAAKILANWELLQIMEHQAGASGVARMALDLAEQLYQQADERWSSSET